MSSYTISHGRAVTLGLKIILKNSLKHGYIDKELFGNAIALIEKQVGKLECPYTVKEICLSSLNDKKRSGDYITLIMVYGVGDCRLVKIKVDELWGYLD